MRSIYRWIRYAQKGTPGTVSTRTRQQPARFSLGSLLGRVSELKHDSVFLSEDVKRGLPWSKQSMCSQMLQNWCHQTRRPGNWWSVCRRQTEPRLKKKLSFSVWILRNALQMELSFRSQATFLPGCLCEWLRSRAGRLWKCQPQTS